MALLPFEVHVFFLVDGAQDFNRDRHETLDAAIDWANFMFEACDHPQYAVVYEFSAIENEHGTYDSTRRYERRAEPESEKS